MRIAFYAPMKSPFDPRPSGDRTMARHLMAALRSAGHEVVLASRFRSWDAGNPARQERLGRIGRRIADRFLRRQATMPSAEGGGGPIDLWFTYHLYHKAPDWLGPRIARALRIPYVVAEASVAGKRRHGPFAANHAASVDALAAADLVLGLNPADRPGVMPHLAPGALYRELAPFLDVDAFPAKPEGNQGRSAAPRDGLDVSGDGMTTAPTLLAVGMMRDDQKRRSYKLLAAALARLNAPFRLMVVGSGPAEPAVRSAFAPLGPRVDFLGEVAPFEMPALYAAADLFVWPAIKEAFGMALLEAQASGLPVVAGASGGVGAIVRDGITGRLVREGDVAAFSAAVADLLANTDLRRQMGRDARARTERHHSLAAAGRALDAALTAARRRHASMTLTMVR